MATRQQQLPLLERAHPLWWWAIPPPPIGTGPWWSGTIVVSFCIGTPGIGFSFRAAHAASSCTDSPEDGSGGNAG
jgi:hypothetical protein